MTTRHKKHLVFFRIAFNILYDAIIKRKLRHSVGTSKFTAPDPLGHYTFLYRINTSGIRKQTFIKKAENVKKWYCENNLKKTTTAVNNFRNTLHRRYLIGFWICLFLILNRPGFQINQVYTGFWIWLSTPE